MRKNCSSDREKLFKFKAEGREFAKILNCERSAQLLVTKFFLLVPGGFSYRIGKNYRDLETFRKS